MTWLAGTTFGLAELHEDGWLLRSELTFSDFEEAIRIAKKWPQERGPIGVADAELRQLVWRSDRGPLAFPFLGVKPQARYQGQT